METLRGPGRGVPRVSVTLTDQGGCLCRAGCKIRLGTVCRNRWRARRHENLWRISASAEAHKEIWFYSRGCRCRCHRAVQTRMCHADSRESRATVETWARLQFLSDQD